MVLKLAEKMTGLAGTTTPGPPCNARPQIMPFSCRMKLNGSTFQHASLEDAARPNSCDFLSYRPADCKAIRFQMI